MITTDIYGNTLTNTFTSKTTSASQRLKPKVMVDWLQSKNCTSLSYTVDSNNAHSSTNQGSLGYYFSPEQAMNGHERQSFTWAVTNAKDIDGNIIKADGTWYTMPSDLSDDFEFGWWSGSISTTNVESTYGGYEFVNNPTLIFTFDSRKCNLIRIVTSEYYGQVHTYRLTVRSSDAGVANPLYTEVITIPANSYYYEHYLPSTLGHSTINTVEVEVISTRNPEDYARIQEINPIYQTDVSDEVISVNYDITRDLHTTELPIAGSGAGSLSVTLDNTDKSFNIFNSSSTYGQYMKKNVKINSSIGWQVSKYDSLFVEKHLTSSINQTDTSFSLNNTDDLPDGGSGDYYVMIIDPDNYTREYVLVSGVVDDRNLTIAQRGFNNSIARSHSADTKIVFETYEYPEYTTTYVDEWQGQTGDMSVGAGSSDWTKFASEKIITNGFFLEKVTTADAVENLLMRTNYPKADFSSLNKYDKSALSKGAILHMNFSERVVDRSGTDLPVKNGLRARFFAIPAERFNTVKDIVADALDKQLSELEKALGDKAFTVPDYTVNTVDINDTNTYALDLVDFTFTDANGDTIEDYYNMVFDGYYTPGESGDQVLAISIQHGGVRLYLEDTLILDSYRVHDVGVGVYEDIESEVVNLVAGKPYKIRIESFYGAPTNATDGFAIYLQYAVGSDPLAIVPIENVYTMAAIDRIGSADAPYTAGSTDRNKVRNNGVYIGDISVGKDGGLVSDAENYSVHFTSTDYMRLPYDLSWDLNSSSSENYSGEWSIELYIKPTTSGFGGDYAYISSFDSASPSGGFEFYADSSEHGFKIKTSSGIESVSVSGTLSNSAWSHVLVTYDGTNIKYYLNGDLQDTLAVVGTISSWSNLDIAFGGRNAYYLVGTGEVAPSSLKDFYLDQFLIYNKTLSTTQVADRYTEAVMQPLTVYPFLYGNEASARDIIEEITLADLGRFYIDEVGKAKYEHFYAYFEPSINRHAVTQMTIDDDTSILEANYNVQLQANKVVVKIAGLSSNLVGVQPLWNAEDPTTLAVVNLETTVNSTATSITVSSTEEPPFSKTGYLVLDNEIVKYGSKSENAFSDLERGLFGTTAASHTSGTAVREVRYWDLKYSKGPAFEVKDPFITGIRFESPQEIDILKWEPQSYGAELIVSANANVDKGTFVFAQGTNPLTEKVAFTAVAGTPVLLTEQDSQIKEQVADLSENIRQYGVKEVVIENPFITDFDHGQKIADFIISKMGEPVPIINLSTMLTPKLTVGDRLKITSLDAFDIINGEYWVISKGTSYSTSPSQSISIRKVV